MKKGLTTLGVAALALLSGSVFAAGPTIDQIPTVIVTDRTTDPNNFDGISVTSGPTSNLFRFTDAIDLTAYVSDADTATGSLKYLFSERDNPGDTVESSPSTIAIDGLTGSAYATTQSNVDASGQFIPTSDPLDFRNVKFSPGTGAGPFSAPAGLPESRTIRLYVSDATSMATGDFTVITTNATGEYDRTSAATTTLFYGPETPIDTFDNWNVVQITTFATIATPGSPYPASPESVTLTTATPTDVVDFTNGTTLRLAHQNVGSTYPSINATLSGTGTNGLAVLWASGNTQAQAVTAGNLYRLRWTLTSTDASVTNHSTIRVREGDYNKIGYQEEVIDKPLGPTNGSPFSYNGWFVPKSSGSMAFAFDVYDFSATASINAGLDSVSVNYTDRARLATAGTATVLKNVGNPSFTAFAGEPTPDASTVSNFGSNTAGYTNFATLVGTNRPVTVTASGTAITHVISSRTTNPDETFTAFSFGNITSGNGFIQEATGNTLVVTDMWISAPSGAGDNLPVVRFGYSAAGSLGLSASLAYVSGAATQNGNGGTANAGAFQTSSRMYSHAFQPQIGSGAVDYRFDTNILVFDNTAGTLRPVPYSGTVQFDRVTVTQYSGLPTLN